MQFSPGGGGAGDSGGENGELTHGASGGEGYHAPVVVIQIAPTVSRLYRELMRGAPGRAHHLVRFSERLRRVS